MLPCMADTANNVANISDVVPRKPGPPKGSPKPAGSGRQKGTRNRVTKEIAEIAQKHGKVIVDGLVKEFKTTDDLDVKVKIASLVLSYGYGQPTRRSEVSGPDGSPIQQQTEILESAQRIAQVFAEVSDKDSPGEVMGDESLGAIMSINFVTAQREAAQHARNPVRTSTPPAVDTAPDPSSQPEEPIPDVETPQADPEAPPEGHTLSFVEGTLCIVGCPPDRDGLPPVYEVRTNGGSMVRRSNFDTALELVRKHAGGDLGRWVLQEPRPQPGFSRPDQHALRQPVHPQVNRRRPRI